MLLIVLRRRLSNDGGDSTGATAVGIRLKLTAGTKGSGIMASVRIGSGTMGAVIMLSTCGISVVGDTRLAANEAALDVVFLDNGAG